MQYQQQTKDLVQIWQAFSNIVFSTEWYFTDVII